VLISKWDKEFLPMAASTNATRLYWGTAWTSQTLLGREMRLARQAEQADGVQRLFTLSSEQVGEEAPAYSEFVAEQVRRLGRLHPHVRTQLFNEEIDSESGMFPSPRRMLMQGSHPYSSLHSRRNRQPGDHGEGVASLAFLLDVGGQDESSSAAGLVAELANPRRDSSALTVVQVDTPVEAQGPTGGLPVYRVVYRRLWTGLGQADLLQRLLALVEALQPEWIVVDSTGIGAGLASHLQRLASGPRLVPYHFTLASKSDLGWKFLSIVDTGRYREYALPGDSPPAAWPGLQAPADLDDPAMLQDLFWKQVEACQIEVLPGPQRHARWGVPPGRRDPHSGAPLHDDLLISAALCAALESLPHRLARSALLPSPDPLGRYTDAY
jgi:hypothetical protein